MLFLIGILNQHESYTEKKEVDARKLPYKILVLHMKYKKKYLIEKSLRN